MTSSVLESAGLGVPGLEGIRGNSSREAAAALVGDNSEDFVSSNVTSSSNPRKPRSPSSASVLFDWDNSFCHSSWEIFSLEREVRSNCREDGFDVRMSRKCFLLRGLSGENVRSPFNTSTNNK